MRASWAEEGEMGSLSPRSFDNRYNLRRDLLQMSKTLEPRKPGDPVGAGSTTEGGTVNGWLPISGAPKDGRSVILWGVSEDGPLSRPHIGMEDIHVAYWDKFGWRATWLDCWIVEPTHWHPFPSTGPSIRGEARD